MGGRIVKATEESQRGRIDIAILAGLSDSVVRWALGHIVQRSKPTPDPGEAVSEASSEALKVLEGLQG